MRVPVAALQAMLVQAQIATGTAPPRIRKQALATLLAGLQSMVDRASAVRNTEAPTGYRVTRADGRTSDHTTLASAAKAYGCKPESLRVRLSAGRGKCSGRGISCTILTGTTLAPPA